MLEARDFWDRPRVYARAEPDDEYDPTPEPLDPFLIDRDQYDPEEEEEEELNDEDDL